MKKDKSTTTKLSEIDSALSPCVRVDLNPDAVESYAELSDKLPPVVLFRVKGLKKLLIGDGRHRIEARKAAGEDSIRATIIDGTEDDAWAYALHQNEEHGVRRTKGDKRLCVEQAILRWPNKTQKEISEICNVSRAYVGRVNHKFMVPEAEEARAPHVSSADTTPAQALPSDTVSEDNDWAEEDKEYLDKLQCVQQRGPLRDATGFPVPLGAAEYLERNSEVQELMLAVSCLKSRINKAVAEKDKMYAEISQVSLQAVLGCLDELYQHLKCCRSHAVCTTCQGHPETQPKGNCPFCFGKGLISEFRWTNMVPKELKDLRLKQSKKDK